jgi:hypothetical protein
MAKAKPKKKRAKSGPGFFAKLAGSVAWFATPRRMANAALAIVFVGIGVGSLLGAGPLRERVSTLRDHPVTPKIEYPRLLGASDPDATWLPASERRRLEHLVVQTVSTNVFDRSSLENLRIALDASGWFARDIQVRRFAENNIRVRGEWRVPFAAVRVNDRDHLVTSAGELLPLAYNAGGAGPSIPVVTSSQFGPPENEARGFAYGKRWRGGDVPASLALIAELKRAFGATPRIMKQIAGVDCRDFNSRGRLAIITDTGSRIVWGSAPGEEKPGEARAAEKIARLVDLSGRPDSRGRIDAGARQISIFGPHVYIDVPAPGAAQPD